MDIPACVASRRCASVHILTICTCSHCCTTCSHPHGAPSVAASGGVDPEKKSADNDTVLPPTLLADLQCALSKDS
jgi:hypothetical protein